MVALGRAIRFLGCTALVEYYRKPLPRPTPGRARYGGRTRTVWKHCAAKSGAGSKRRPANLGAPAPRKPLGTAGAVIEASPVSKSK